MEDRIQIKLLISDTDPGTVLTEPKEKTVVESTQYQIHLVLFLHMLTEGSVTRKVTADIQ